MKLLKKRKSKKDLEKTLTILDSATNEVKEIIDIIDEPKEIILNDSITEDTYSEIQIKDMSFMGSLRDTYPDMKDMETILTDACKSHKLLMDEKNKDLTDEEVAAEKLKLDALAKSETAAAKLLLDEQTKLQDASEKRRIEVEEAERTRHAAAQKN